MLNRSEEVTYERLKAACEPVGAHVFAEVRLADVLPVERSGISNEEFTFCIKSHFDFLVTNENYVPEFSVEFDGPTHDSDIQKRRDQTKNHLCERFEYPLLRINSRYLNRQYRGYDLLTYFVDVWSCGKAFCDAQAHGHVPLDEPFEPCWILYDGKTEGKDWPLWLSFDHQCELTRLHAQGLVAQPGASHWVGVGKEGTHHCIT